MALLLLMVVQKKAKRIFFKYGLGFRGSLLNDTLQATSYAFTVCL